MPSLMISPFQLATVATTNHESGMRNMTELETGGQGLP